PRVDAPSTEDVEDYYEDEEDEFDSLTSKKQSNNLLPFLIIAGIAVIAVIAGLLFVANLLMGGGSDETPTEVVIATDLSPVPILPTFDSEAVTEEVTE